MRLSERYVSRLTTISFLAALTALTGVIWITQSLREMNLVTAEGQTIWTFLLVTGLTIPSLLVGIAPIALFIGVVYTLTKLDSDSELVVLSAAGVSPLRLLRPFLVVAFATTSLCALVSLWAMPASFHEITDLLMNIRADFLTRVIQAGSFANLDHGFIFEYRERGADGSLRGIFMQDRRDPSHISTYIAQSGETTTSDGQNFLVLDKGLIQRQSAESADPATVTFDRYAIDLSQFAADGHLSRKPRERSTWSLLWPDPKDPAIKKNPGAFRAELNDRFSQPLYAIVLTMIAFAALGRAQTTRQGRGVTIAAATLAAIVVRGAGFWASALTQRHAWGVWLVYGLPTAGLIGATVYLFEPLQPRTLDALLELLPLPSRRRGADAA